MFNLAKQKIYNLLRWSEKWLKTDMIYMAKGGFWINFGQFFSSLSSFLLVIAMGNMLSKEDYGTYKYIFSVLGFLSISTFAEVNMAAIKSVTKGLEGSIQQGAKMKFRTGLIGSLASMLVAGYYFYSGNDFLTIAFLIIACFLPFVDTFTMYESLLTGKKKFKESTKYYIATQIVSAIALFLCIWLTKNILLLILVYFTSLLIPRIFFFFYSISKFQKNKQTDPGLFSFGLNLTASTIIGTLSMQLDKLLLWHFAGAAPLAIYSFAIAPVAQTRSFIKPITTLAIPKVSERKVSELKKSLPRKAIVFFVPMLAIVALYILLIPFFYKIFFPKYIDSILYSQLYVLVLLFMPKKLYTVSILMHANKKKLFLSGTLPSIFYIAVLAILLPTFGIIGAIATNILTEIFTLVFSILLFHSLNDEPKQTTTTS